MGLQRHLKVAGIFARLTLRDGKPKYLADTPRFIAYIRATAGRYRELAPLLRLLDEVEGHAGRQRLRLRPGLSAGPRMPRFYCPAPLAAANRWSCRRAPHAMCRCCGCSPARRITLFDGQGGEFDAVVEHMGRSDVRVQVGAHHAASSAKRRAQVHLAVGMPANERMDWLVEKATELGAAGIQPLVAERSVLRLDRRTGAEEAGALAGHRDRRLRAMRPQPGAGDPRGHGHGALAGHASAARSCGWCCRCLPRRGL